VRADWGEAFRLLAEHFGWTFAQIAELTPDQLACARGHAGRPARGGMIEIRSRADITRLMRQVGLI
jgi:hypothetical protein